MVLGLGSLPPMDRIHNRSGFFGCTFGIIYMDGGPEMRKQWWDDDPAPLWSIVAAIFWFSGLVAMLLLVG